MANEKSFVSKLRKYFYSEPYFDALDVAFCENAKVGMMVLDAGCGPLRGCSNKAPLKDIFIVGTDIDPAVHENPYCNKTVVCDLSKRLPFEDNTFDLIHCRWVLEHISDPSMTFSEFARILKPGGKLLALTPNIFHYATIMAKITPFWFHCWWRHGGTEDPFPTYYRANSSRKLQYICKKAGFLVECLDFIEVCSVYLQRHWPLFLCGILYERIVNSTSLLKYFRQRIILQAIKKPFGLNEQKQ